MYINISGAVDVLLPYLDYTIHFIIYIYTYIHCSTDGIPLNDENLSPTYIYIYIASNINGESQTTTLLDISIYIYCY